MDFGVGEVPKVGEVPSVGGSYVSDHYRRNGGASMDFGDFVRFVPPVGQMSNAILGAPLPHLASSLAAAPRTLGCRWTFVQRALTHPPTHPPAHPLTRSPTHRPLKNWRRGRAGLGRGLNCGRKKTPHLSVWGEDCVVFTCWL
jgi:hypothetical protein